MGKPKNPKNPSSEPEQRRLPKTIAKNWDERGKGTPPVAKVHEAYRDKKITFEEAQDLNPKYTGLAPNTVNYRKRKGKNGSKTGIANLTVGSDGTIGRRPTMLDVRTAHRNKKITEEEAKDLNPYYGSPKPQINRKHLSIPEGGHVPAVGDIHRAVANKHIDVEQAVNLNPKYADKNTRGNATNYIRARGETLPRVPHFDSEMKKIMGGGS